jgi:NAD(P)-dependent dehydrogenase (short-subunit alcohol dehydrogenase family)
MSKAALNMITETEAAACWHDRCVCMNSVHPGYMSAAPGFGRNGNVPLGWEDGAGRVLWPVAVGWGKREVSNGKGGRAVWGKVLEASSSVEVGWGKVFDTIAWWRNGWGLCFKHTQYFRDHWPWFGVSEYTSIQS